MKLVIYRNKETNKIVRCHEVSVNCTEEDVRSYNNSRYFPNKVEIVELDEIAEYLYTLKKDI